jgi:hypothetical protein
MHKWGERVSQQDDERRDEGFPECVYHAERSCGQDGVIIGVDPGSSASVAGEVFVMPCVVRWADPSVYEANLIRKYCPSLADKIEAAGPYGQGDVDPTKEELRQFRAALGLPEDLPWWRQLMKRGDQRL